MGIKQALWRAPYDSWLDAATIAAAAAAVSRENGLSQRAHDHLQRIGYQDV